MVIPPRCLRFAALAVLLTPIQSHLAAQSEADVNASLKKFTQVYEAVESNFADKVDADNTVFNGAIPNMLRTLDPHSNFFDPKAYALMREGQVRPLLRRRHVRRLARRQSDRDVPVRELARVSEPGCGPAIRSSPSTTPIPSTPPCRRFRAC